jgi:serine protease
MSDPGLTTIGVGISTIRDGSPSGLRLYGTVNFFTFWNPPVGMYTTAQDFFDGKPSIDTPQIITVDVQDPVFDDTLNTVTIPEMEGVDYLLNGVAALPGTHNAAVGRMVVTYVAKSGYRVFGPAYWDHEFRPPPKEIVPVAPTFNGETGQFTVPYMEGVQYWVNDSIWGSSTFSSEWDTTVYIRAEALTGYKLSGTTSWQYYFAKPDQPADPGPVTPTEPAGSFTDIPAGTQFATEINWLAGRGISTGWVDGNGDATYRPLTPVNRDAMAAFMYRLLGEPPFNAPATSPFADMAGGTKFYKEITWLADKRISAGWEANGVRTYRPVTPVNRDAMAAFLYRLAGEPDFTPPLASPFVDVDTSNQFYKEITWLAAKGISTGWDEGNGRITFRPLSAVNRDAMAAFMYRWNTKFGRP